MHIRIYKYTIIIEKIESFLMHKVYKMYILCIFYYIKNYKLLLELNIVISSIHRKFYGQTIKNYIRLYHVYA